MTSYHGGKSRIGDQISNILATFFNDYKLKGYCEPFCGMLGVYRHMPGKVEKITSDNVTFLAGDVNNSLILMWTCLQKGWLPPKKTSKNEFYSLKYDGTSSAKKGFLGHAASFSGQYFTTYSKKNAKLLLKTRERMRGLVGKIKKVQFCGGSYTQFNHLKNYLIYCDAPYTRSSWYYDEKHKLRSFDHGRYLDWCKRMAKDNIVVISEYEQFPGTTILWSNKVTTSYMGKSSTKKELLLLVNGV